MTTLTTEFNIRTDDNGTPGTIINSPLNTGDSFFLEVLMGDIRDDAVGITSSNIAISFDSNQLQNINNSFDPASLSSPLLPSTFPLFRTGILDKNNGTISNLGAGSLPNIGLGSAIGVNQLDTFSLVHFQVIETESSTVTLNIDLGQTAFLDGTFASESPNQSQFSQLIEVTSSNPSPIPEPSVTIGLVLIGVLSFFRFVCIK
ncbi:PEP-CTERM sorting domain-containing protein [Crocosphaera sp.]|uniref:PEP-CTERM sorting domain-containing protein n=1 Tax=Crocosphaera sp. TaxID=2729996 RepID=UPI003F247512|nr:PEP-CTERM sorting domain-containing protein [Crocosphaera sp.]